MLCCVWKIVIKLDRCHAAIELIIVHLSLLQENLLEFQFVESILGSVGISEAAHQS